MAEAVDTGLEELELGPEARAGAVMSGLEEHPQHPSFPWTLHS